ncbi:MAG: hypothetical protein IJ733_00430 [Lachnospiraceae bacterium]|nr:hypothetical protein [Lachnospiraceae bacterium]
MHFPLTASGEADVHAGEKLMEKLREKNIRIPVIVCSSLNYRIPEADACVWYSEHNNWEWELGKLVKKFSK